MNVSQPFREFLLRKHAPHYVGLAQTRGKKILSRRLVIKRTILVVQKKFPRRIDEKFDEGIVMLASRIVEHKPEPERGLIVFADPHRMFQLRQPSL